MSKFDEVIVVEEKTGNGGTVWVVSFDGKNPVEDKCIIAENKQGAFALVALINEHMKRVLEKAKKGGA